MSCDKCKCSCKEPEQTSYKCIVCKRAFDFDRDRKGDLIPAYQELWVVVELPSPMRGCPEATKKFQVCVRVEEWELGMGIEGEERTVCIECLGEAVQKVNLKIEHMIMDRVIK